MRRSREVPSEPWGYHVLMDLYKCSPINIRNKEYICSYVHSLCELIGMKRFGDCLVIHFGSDPKVEGFSMVQLIETSLISGHFCNYKNSAHIDIFSCKKYDQASVIEFTKNTFLAESVNSKNVFRG